MNVTELKAKIKDGDIGGVYIFAGEEDYLKKFYAAQMAKIAAPDEAFALFNKQLFEGEDIDFAAIKEAVSSPPMFSDRKLIEHRYPDLEHTSESERKALEELADLCAEYPYATVLFVVSADLFDAGTVKRPSRLAARLSKKINLVNFEKSTDAQLVAWLRRHFEHLGVKVSAGVPEALIFRSGHSMQVLKGEVDKLAAYAAARSLPVLTEHEVALVASPTSECDAFALSGAIADRSRQKALEALYDMQLRRLDANAILATLSRAFNETATVAFLLSEGKDAQDIEKLLGWNAYKIKICISSARRFGQERLAEALGRLRELDAASKSGGITGMAPIEMFICEFI